MNQTFNAFFNFYKNTKFGDIGNLALHCAAHRIFLDGYLPGVWLHLLDSKRKPLVLAVDLEYHGLDGFPLGIFL